MQHLEYAHVSDASDNVTFLGFPSERQGSLSDSDKLQGQRHQLLICLPKYLFLQL